MQEWQTTARSVHWEIKGVHDQFRVELPQTAVEWADQNFYLSAESSGTVGRWETLPFQRAILNSMGSPDVPKVTVFKSARCGFTKMMLAGVGYHLVKRKRSVALWQPTDGDRNEFTKDEIDTAIRDSKPWRAAFPAFNKKSSDNTVDRKAFLGATLWLKGATSAKNFRRITPDVVCLDEVDAMPLDIDGEGSAEALSWKRAEVSSFRKQIVGSSPKEAGSSQIEASANKADALLRFFVQCPHCGDHHRLEFGGKGTDHGLKWEKDKPETVKYFCPHCGAGWPNSDLLNASEAGFWRDEVKGVTTKDGLIWRKDGEPCSAPRHVAFHIWSAYSPFTTWREIIEEWVAAQGDPLALKTFVNTTLGETWEAQEGELIKPAQLKSRSRDEMPNDVRLVTLGIDVQGDRFEAQYLGHCASGDMVVLGYEVIPAETDRLQDWKDRLLPLLDREFRFDGMDFAVEATGIDTGGGSTATAYDFCALYADRHVLAMKGMAGDRPIVPLRASRNWRKRGLDGWPIGTHAAKDVIMASVAREEGRGRLLFPEGVDLPSDYFEQLLSERRTLKIVKNHKTYLYQKRSQSARNEALDVTVYGLAAARWLQIHRNVDLQARELADGEHYTGFDLF